MSNTAMKIGHVLPVALLLGALIANDVQAQDLHPSRRPSPVGIARTHIGDTYVKVTYGRPYVRGRQIFGANDGDTEFLVPFGEIWRTGANEATEITFTGDLMIDGHRVDAGTYAIFTEPREDAWTIHFSPQLGLDGTGRFDPATGTFTPVFDPSMDVLAIEVPSQATDEEIDQFTIDFEPDDDAVDMVLRWERTEVRIPLRPSS